MFAKVFQQIFESSIAEDYSVRHVFMDLLVLADLEGVVDKTHEAIARITNVPLDMVKAAIEQLEAPDKKSRSDMEEGRRLVRLDEHRDWGWQIVNYEIYRNIRDEEARRAYFREKKREYRARDRQSKNGHSSPPASNDVLDSPIRSNVSTHTDTEADTDTKRERGDPPKRYVAEIPKSLQTPEFQKSWIDWKEYKQDSRRGANWNHAGQRYDLAFLERLGSTRACQVIDHTIRGGLDRLCEPIELRSEPTNRNGTNGHSGSGFLTRENVEIWCKKNNCFKIVDRVWGAVMSGKFYGAKITNETDLRSAMETVKAQWMREP